MIKTILNILCPALGIAKGLNVAAAGMAAATIGSAAIGAVGSNMAANTAADGAKSAAEAANSPWSAAQPYISGEFQPAQDALNSALGMGAYTGERAAGLNPYQVDGANSTAAYANGNGVDTANQFYNTGMGLTSSGSNFGTNAGNLLAQSQQDPTQGFISYGNQVANSSTTQGMIDAANTDVTRALNQNQLPTLANNAAGSGNTDSTRTGVQSAILQSQAQENMLNNASTIRGQMFNTGLQTAQSQYNDNATQALNANQQVGSAYQLGSSALLNGQQANGNNFDQTQAAGGVFQTQQQQQDAAAQSQFNDQQQVPLNLIGQYMNVIGGKWGGQAVSSVGPNSTAAAIQGATGGAALGAGIAQKLGGYSSSTPAMSSLNGVSYQVPDDAAASYYNGGGNSFGFSMS